MLSSQQPTNGLCYQLPSSEQTVYATNLHQRTNGLCYQLASTNKRFMLPSSKQRTNGLCYQLPSKEQTVYATNFQATNKQRTNGLCCVRKNQSRIITHVGDARTPHRKTNWFYLFVFVYSATCTLLLNMFTCLCFVPCMKGISSSKLLVCFDVLLSL